MCTRTTTNLSTPAEAEELSESAIVKHESKKQRWHQRFTTSIYKRVTNTNGTQRSTYRARTKLAITSANNNSYTDIRMCTSNTQSVIEALSMGTRIARPFSLPFSSGKMVAIAVADPVEVGARLSMPERQRLKSCRRG